MQSVMSHNFATLPRVNIPRSVFDRSHGLKTAFDCSKNYPIFWDEVLPGDTFKMKATILARLSTPIHPIMDNIFLDTFYFFVPNRLLWDHWEEFNGAHDAAGAQDVDYTIPVVTTPVGGHTALDLFDYFGLPVGVDDVDPNALHFRAYNKIHNDWFREQNTRPDKTENTGDGPDAATDYELYSRSKRYDYFTGCLPYPQKGDAVEVPIGTEAPVYGNGKTLGLTDGTNTAGLYEEPTSGSGRGIANRANLYNVNVGTAPTTGSLDASKGLGVVETGESGLVADLSSATAATINQLREAFQVQRMLEKDARGGTRYTEILQSHFGVTSPDFRLQRSEYLGGGRQRINISQVAQTSPTTDGAGAAGTPQGNLAAFGLAAGSAGGFNKSFTEHGVIIGLACVTADLTYQEGIDRMWSRQTRYDFYWPALAHLGEQEVLNKEIYSDGSANDDLVFGYQERYAEYRFKGSKITSYMRSNHAQSLEAWHCSEEFGSLPTLAASFMRDGLVNVIDRCLAVTTNTPQVIFDAHFDLKCARPMPVYGTPGYIDHF